MDIVNVGCYTGVPWIFVRVVVFLWTYLPTAFWHLCCLRSRGESEVALLCARSRDFAGSTQRRGVPLGCILTSRKLREYTHWKRCYSFDGYAGEEPISLILRNIFFCTGDYFKSIKFRQMKLMFVFSESSLFLRFLSFLFLFFFVSWV